MQWPFFSLCLLFYRPSRLHGCHPPSGRAAFSGQRGKIRFVPVHAMAKRLIEEYLAVAGHGSDTVAPEIRPVTNNRTGVKTNRAGRR